MKSHNFRLRRWLEMGSLQIRHKRVHSDALRPSMGILYNLIYIMQIALSLSYWRFYFMDIRLMGIDAYFGEQTTLKHVCCHCLTLNWVYWLQWILFVDSSNKHAKKRVRVKIHKTAFTKIWKEVRVFENMLTHMLEYTYVTFFDVWFFLCLVHGVCTKWWSEIRL